MSLPELKSLFAVYGTRHTNDGAPVFDALKIHGLNAQDCMAVLNLACAMDDSTRPSYLVLAFSNTEALKMAKKKHENPASVQSTPMSGVEVIGLDQTP